MYVCRVNGFDHKPFDQVQQNWHEHLFPYKLAQYKKRLLTAPTCLLEIDYAEIVSLEESAWLALSLQQSVMLPVIAAGRCHGVAIWVDFGFPSNNTSVQSASVKRQEINAHDVKESIEYFRTAYHTDDSNSECNYDFPLYHTCSLKFFPEPITVTRTCQLNGNVGFNHGDSDFSFTFEF